MAAILSIDLIPRTELVGRRVMVRIAGEEDVQNSLSTVAFLSRSGARVVIAADQHLDDNRSRLSHLLARQVYRLDEWKGEAGLRAVAHLPEGGIAFIEDLALEPGERSADDSLAKELAHLCDIYCNDAFAVSHEARASTVTVAKKAKLAVAGLGFRAELSLLEIMLGGPPAPTLAVLGGELSREKLLLAEEIARRTDHMLMAGRLTIPFLVAKGVLQSDVAASDEMLAIAERMMKEAQEDKRFIATPTDFVVMDKTAFERLSRGERFLKIPASNVTENELTTDQIVCDIGTLTQWSWSDLFAHVRRIFWHGPLGICEIDIFCEGSRFVASQLVSRTWPDIHRTVVCGHSLVAGLHRVGFQTERIRHLTSSGRAALHYFAGRPLPAVEVLNKTLEPTHSAHHVLIPLDGSENDSCVLHAAAETVARDAKVFLLHVRSGLDEQEHPDVFAALTDAERLQRRLQSEHIFAEANAILASRGLVAATQVTGQGKPNDLIARYATRVGARLIVMAGNRAPVVEAGSDTAGAILVAPCNAGRRRTKPPSDLEATLMDKLVINQLPAENLQGKRVFLRIDADADLTRSGGLNHKDKLRVCLPTLEYLRSAGARVVIGTHLGNPGGKTVDPLRLDPVAETLSALLGKTVHKLDSVIGEDVLRTVTEMKDGEMVLIENLRFHPGEDANDPHFALDLAELCHVYCDDAFALAYRAMGSTVAIARYVRPAVAGLSLSHELTMFEAALHRPEPPFLGIMAGAHIEKKLPVLENLLPRLDFLFIGGALAFTFLRAKGYGVGAAPVAEECLHVVKDFLRNAKVNRTEVVFPLDFMVVDADDFQAFEMADHRISPPEARHALDNELFPRDLPVDIGPRTLGRIRNLIDRAHTILWNGPLGMAELEPFAAGTRQVARALLGEEKRAIISGDSLSRALRSSDVPVEKLRHLSTGAESALVLLAGNHLPAVAALDDAAEASTTGRRRRRSLLLPVDDSTHSIEAVRRIGECVDSEGVEISLLYVQAPSRYLWLHPETKRLREIKQRYKADRVFMTVNAELARQGLISHRQLTADGKPANQILRYADEIGADLIVMGSRGRDSVGRIVMGSVSHSVSNRAKCPVLIIRRTPDEEVRKAA